MNKRYYYGLTGGFLILFMILCLVNAGTIKAQEQCKIIAISGQAFPDVSIQIEPKTLVISKGDCVVWINWVRAAEIKVNFKEGKKCVDTTQAPSGFNFEKESGCYLTDFIPLGGTSSLRFMQEGSYDYSVEAPGIKYTMKGTIMVKK